MWPLGKRKEATKAGDDAEANPKQAWTLYLVKLDDGPMVVRLQQNAGNGNESLKYMVGVATPLHSPNANGMHDAAEGAQLGVIEDAVIAALEKDAKAVFVLSNCSKGAKEWVLYTHDPEFVKGEFVKLRDATKTHKLQLLIRGDPKWDTYAAFVKLSRK